MLSLRELECGQKSLRERFGVGMGFDFVTAGTGKDAGTSSQVPLCARVKTVNLFTMQVKWSLQCGLY